MPVRDLLSAASGTGGATDPYFYDVSLLLNGDGTNGAQNNTFLDSSTNNFTITRSGNTTQGSFSPYGNLWSNYFDGGSSTYLTTPSSSNWDFGSNAFTIECWVNMAQYITGNGESATDDWIASLWSGANGYWVFRIGNGSSNNALRFNWNNFSSAVSASSDLPLNQWVHVVVSCNGSTISLFQNGTRVGTTSISGITSSGGYPVYIGNINNFQRPFNGYISNLRIVNGTDVYGATNTTITVPTAPLTAITNTKLLTCQSNRFLDASSNAYTITPSGGSSVQRFSPFNPTAPYSTATIGGSGYFNSSYLNFTGNSSLAFGTGNFTIEGWYYKTGSITGAPFLIGGSGSGNWALLIGQNNIFLQNDQSNNNIIAYSFTSASNTWYHVAWVRNGSTNTLYINGISVATVSDSTNYSLTSSTYYIGLNTDSSSYLFPGYISDVRVLNGTALYTSNFTPPTTPLTAITNTKLLENFTNAGIPDLAMQNDLQTVGSAQVSTSVKKYGTGSLYFATSGDYLKQSATINLGNTWTIEYWYQTSTTPTYHNITLSNQANGGGSCWMGPSTSAFAVTNGGTSLNYSYTPTYNTWEYYAIVNNAGTLSVYVNGTRIGSPQTGINSFAIDSINGYPLNLWVGYIDDLRITNGYARYTSNFTPPTSALPTY